MKDQDGWVMASELKLLCSDCLEAYEFAGMVSCTFGRVEFPAAIKCLTYFPLDQAEGG